MASCNSRGRGCHNHSLPTPPHASQEVGAGGGQGEARAQLSERPAQLSSPAPWRMQCKLIAPKIDCTQSGALKPWYARPPRHHVALEEHRVPCQSMGFPTAVDRVPNYLPKVGNPMGTLSISCEPYGTLTRLPICRVYAMADAMNPKFAGSPE